MVNVVKVSCKLVVSVSLLLVIILLTTKPTFANPGVKYVGPGMSNTEEHMRGTRCVQQALHITEDGLFGQQTYDAVRAFQQAHGLSVDGIVGPNTGDQLIGFTTDPYSCAQWIPTSYTIMEDNGQLQTGGQVVNPERVREGVVPIGGSVKDCLVEGVKASFSVGGIVKVLWKHKFELDPIVAAGDAVGCILLGT
jgi:hypothetical protein